MDPIGLKLVTPPASEPVSLAEAKLHCRVDDENTAEDAAISRMISAAREYAERVTGRQLITATWRLYLDAFPREIRLPRPPLASVTAITYVSADGVTETLDAGDYQVASSQEPAMIAPAYGTSWPSTRPQREAVQVVYVAGYGAASDVPANVRQAILLQVGHMYANREAVVTGTIATTIPLAVRSLLGASEVGHLW